MDAKEALQYVYCVTLSADQANGVGKEQVEIAWGLTRRIIVLANGGPSWEELVGGVRAEGVKFVSRLHNHRLGDNDASFSPELSNKVLHYYISLTPQSSVIKFSSELLVMPKKMTGSTKQSNCTTLQRTILQSSLASLRHWAILLGWQVQMRKRGILKRPLPKF